MKKGLQYNKTSDLLCALKMDKQQAKSNCIHGRAPDESTLDTEHHTDCLHTIFFIRLMLIDLCNGIENRQLKKVADMQAIIGKFVVPDRLAPT